MSDTFGQACTIHLFCPVIALKAHIESDGQIFDYDGGTTLERYVSHGDRIERLRSGNSCSIEQPDPTSKGKVVEQAQDVTTVEGLDRYMAAITCPMMLAEAKHGMKR